MIIKTSNILLYFSLLLIIGVNVILRFYNLGYSEFQGDEIAVLNVTNYDFRDFIYIIRQQLKGPGQYVVVYLLSIINPYFNLSDEIYFRVVFSFASFLGFLFISLAYLRVFKIKLLVINLIVLSGAGILYGLSRIVQYQSFIILSYGLAILSISYYLDNRKKVYLLLSGFFVFSGSIFHYDILLLGIVLPIFLYITRQRKLSIYFAGMLFGGIAACYVLFFGYNGLSTVFDYIINKRLNSIEELDAFYYSVKLMNLYIPKEVLVILAFGIIFYFFNKFRFKKLLLLIFLSILVVFALRYVNVKPNQFYKYINLVLVLVLLFFGYAKKYIKHGNIADKFMILNELLLWVGILVYLVVMSRPLSHIYILAIPASVISSYAIYNLKSNIKTVLLVVYIISATTFYYQVYVSSEPEYPWEKKYYMFGVMKSIGINNRLDGVFGFLYNRDWDDINRKVNVYSQMNNIKNYYTNENKISRYYIRNLEYSKNRPYLYIHITRPSLLRPQEAIFSHYLRLEQNEKYSIYLVN